MKKKSYIIFVLFFLLAALRCFAASSYTFRGLTISEGLSDLLVNTIYKDSWGCVWFGTSNSVDRFDGIDMRHYTFDHADSKMKRVNAITGTSQSRLWVGNNIGLWTLDNKTDKLIQVGVGKLECPVYALLYDNKKTLYIGTEKGLFLFTDENLEEVLLDRNVFSKGNQIKGLCFDKHNNLWITTPIGLYSYHIPTHKVTFYDGTRQMVTDLRQVVCIDETLYVGTGRHGLYQFDLKTKQFKPYLSVGCEVISSLSTDGKDKLYVGTDGGGVSFLSIAQHQVIRTIKHDVNDRASIRSNSVYSLLVDKEGIVWIGYYQSGVDYSLYQSGLFDVYHWGAFTTQNMAVRSFALDGFYKIIGTRDGLYFIDEQKNQVRVYNSNQLQSNLIFSIGHFRKEFYIGTYNGGLWILNPQTGDVRRCPSNFPVFTTGTVFDMCTDTNGNLWFATSAGVYSLSVNGAVTEYTNRNSQLPEGQVYAVFFDSNKKGWFGTEGGLAVFDPSSHTIKTNIFPDGFANNEVIRSIYEDSRHQLYFLPDKGALFVSSIDLKQTSRIPLFPAIQSTACLSIVEDTNGKLWLGCDNGLVSLSPNAHDGSYAVYGFNDGLLSSVFSCGASFRDASGALWFGTGKGLVSLQHSRLNSVNRNPYPVSITDIFINGTPLTPEMRQYERDNGYFSLTAQQKNLEFHFSSRNFTDPLSMGFEYKMDGVDDDWKVVSGNNKVAYYDLTGGDYAFHVRMVGDPQNEKMYRIHIAYIISPWVWVTIGLALVIFTLLIIRNRKRKDDVALPIEMKEETIDLPVVNDMKTVEEKYKTNKLSEAECKMLSDKLSALMEKEHPYTNPNLKIADLAQQLSTSSHALSYLFNQYLKQSYYDYINEYRISKFKTLSKDNACSRYTLDALSDLCGFSSRATFFRSFKKATGITPNEYLNSIK